MKSYASYWAPLVTRLPSIGLKHTGASTDRVLRIKTGKSEFEITLRHTSSLGKVTADLTMNGPAAQSNANFEQFEKLFKRPYGAPGFQWSRAAEKKESHILTDLSCRPDDEADWDRQRQWLFDKVRLFNSWIGDVSR